MKYFVRNKERRGTCYHEFQKGKWDGETFWKEDSLYLHDDFFSDLRLYSKIFRYVIPNYNSYGPNDEVTREMWDKMMSMAHQIGGKIEEVFKELRPWVEENFTEYRCFSILGI